MKKLTALADGQWTEHEAVVAGKHCKAAPLFTALRNTKQVIDLGPRGALTTRRVPSREF
jgi:hypothetical protein